MYQKKEKEGNEKKYRFSYGYLNVIEKDGKEYMIAMERETNKIVFWNTKTSMWTIFSDTFI